MFLFIIISIKIIEVINFLSCKKSVTTKFDQRFNFSNAMILIMEQFIHDDPKSFDVIVVYS